jgi:diguanylate cyclase (GGDEF)-like protein
MDTKTNFHKREREARSGKSIVNYRWIIVLILIPLFYFASDSVLDIKGFSKVIFGVMAYNMMVTYYLIYEYPKSKVVPEYIYYIDALVVSILVFLFGGIGSDIYILYLFIIASYGVVNTVSKTLKFSLMMVGIYSISSFVYGTIENGFWIFSDELMKMFMRNITIIVISYAVGLIISEVRKADSLHRKEFLRARTDKLTGLPNRHFMEQIIDKEVKDCQEQGKVYNVLMFDIDNFKRFNDTYGHTLGDELLKRFALIVTQSMRKSDIPVRYGGEEFLVLLKDIDFVTAVGVGERVRRQLENQKIDVEDGNIKTRVTVSCGIAQFPTHSTDIKEVIKMADESLYFAKGHGKNVVVGYDELLSYKKENEIQSVESIKEESLVR